MGLRGMNFCTISFPFCTEFCKATKQLQMHPNSRKQTKTGVWDPMGWIGCVRCEKIPMGLHGTKFFTSLTCFTVSVVTQPNSPKCTQIIQNTPKHEFRVQWGGSGVFVAKIPTRLRGKNFCTSLTPFALSAVWQPKSPKCTQIVRNAPKREFRVQWVGSGALIAKNSDATSWHELLHHFCPFCTEFYKATK